MPRAFTGYVVRYHGLTVYYGGDTAYCQENFLAARRTFGHFDLAILPIAPIAPRGFMERTHVDPWESLRAFVDLGADRMVPIHYDSFLNSEDRPGDALASLDIARNGLRLTTDQVVVVPIGGQRVFITR
jgi:L-ascorbate metabolism protein UlaG (beta-lactamase superfamily)